MTRFANPLEKSAYFEQVLFLYNKYARFLDDDYAKEEKNSAKYLRELIERVFPLFWVIVEGDMVSGFVYLDNVIGGNIKFHSAELVTCFDKRFWGTYTKVCANAFLRFVFRKYGFEKIKVYVYPDNFRTRGLIEFCGFEKEAVLKSETLRNGKLQDIEVYSLFKERVKDEDRNRKFDSEIK